MIGAHHPMPIPSHPIHMKLLMCTRGWGYVTRRGSFRGLEHPSCSIPGTVGCHFWTLLPSSD
jgi:hypothetical protein